MRAVGRYALADVAPGALMLDLVSGALFELNESAALVWRRHLAGEPIGSIASALVFRYGLTHEVALLDARSALEIPLEGFPNPPSDFCYRRAEGGYSFAFRGQPVFAIDDKDAEISVLPKVDTTTTDLPYLLRALAPKLLGLLGEMVLHASAVELRDGVVAFCGLSGAGKTTTARALVGAGATPIAEDQLLVRVRGSTVMASTTGERAIGDWVSETAATLAEASRASVGTLERVTRGQYKPLSEIGFIDRTRRTGFQTKDLAAVETAGATFRNAFYGSDELDRWVGHLDLATKVGIGVSGLELSLPGGLGHLAETAHRLLAAGSLRSPSVR